MWIQFFAVAQIVLIRRAIIIIIIYYYYYMKNLNLPKLKSFKLLNSCLHYSNLQ